MSHEAEHHEILPYSLYFKIWGALIALTVVTVAVSAVDLRNVAVFTAMLIATAKAGLVVMYFMHLRYERWLYTAMIFATLGFFGISIALTFADYSFR